MTTTTDTPANMRQARIERFASGLRNGAVEGFTAGGRVTDPIFDGVEWAAQKVVKLAKNLPEKIQGIVDAFKDPG